MHAPAEPVAIPTGPVGVELRGVSFAYPGAEAPVLRDVSFVAEPGTTTAVIGSTGAGKTTLVGLVPRLHDVTSGAVLVGGVDVRAAAPADLWSRIGLVPQRPAHRVGRVRRRGLAADLREAPRGPRRADRAQPRRLARALSGRSAAD